MQSVRSGSKSNVHDRHPKRALDSASAYLGLLSHQTLTCEFTIVMGYSSDLLPHIGEVPGKPGQYIATGYTGYRMPVICLATKAVARMIMELEGKTFEETGLPILYKTSQERLDNERNDFLDT